MPNVSFTPALRRHVTAPEAEAKGSTVREVLEAVFASNPELRSYILDDQGAVRKHIAIYVDGNGLKDRASLSDSVKPQSEIYVLQALSGG